MLAEAYQRRVEPVVERRVFAVDGHEALHEPVVVEEAAAFGDETERLRLMRVLGEECLFLVGTASNGIELAGVDANESGPLELGTAEARRRFFARLPIAAHRMIELRCSPRSEPVQLAELRRIGGRFERFDDCGAD